MASPAVIPTSEPGEVELDAPQTQSAENEVLVHLHAIPLTYTLRTWTDVDERHRGR
jgi:hypothetical protein